MYQILGQSGAARWGEYQGAGLSRIRIRIDIKDANWYSNSNRNCFGLGFNANVEINKKDCVGNIAVILTIVSET